MAKKFVENRKRTTKPGKNCGGVIKVFGINERHNEKRAKWGVVSVVMVMMVTGATAAVASKEVAVGSPPFECVLPSHNRTLRTVRARGESRTVTFYWHDEPSRAAAALLMAATSAAGYFHLHLSDGDKDICKIEAARNIRQRSSVAVEWLKDQAGPDECYMRIISMGEAGAHSALRLHVHPLTSACAPSSTFYEHREALRKCGFFDHGEPQSGEFLKVYALRADHADLVKRCFNGIRLQAELLTRAELETKLNTSLHPVLFVDYNIWSRVAGVEAIELPTSCYRQPNPGFRAVDEYIPVYGKDIYKSLGNFTPEPDHLREVLRMAEVYRGDVLQAACEWGRKHQSTFLDWIPCYRNEYNIVVLLCTNDTEIDKYASLVKTLPNLRKPTDYDINTQVYEINCTRPEALQETIDTFKQSKDFYSLVGVVSNARHTRGAVAEARTRYTPMVLVRESEALDGESTRVAGGGAANVARALRAMLRGAGWSRLALLADDTHETEVLRSHLADLTVKYSNASDLDEHTTGDLLRELRTLDPRIMVLNVEPAKAALVLRAAADLDMTPANGYAWITCGEAVPSPAVPHYAISLWNRGEYASAEAGDAAVRTTVLGHWARHSAALADAVLTLSQAFELFYHAHPQYRNDLHIQDTNRLFWEQYDTSPTRGASGLLHYVKGTLLQSTVFLEWCSNERGCTTVDKWFSGEWHNLSRTFADAPPDGSTKCILSAGDPYHPSCYDPITFTAIPLAVVLLCAVALYVRTTYIRQLAKREAEVRQQLQQWKERSAGALAGYLVDRAALEVDGKLGAGRFGCVQLAILRDNPDRPRPVAVKALREGASAAEESDFLREASMLASLDHRNVIRFVGVCAGDGPPLVLMEHAFFGDLLGYLRARRHLVEGATVDFETPPADVTDLASPGRLGMEEAVHVSATELTRLAREAASALSYLACRGVVHRDLRAANCLVDARRTLKMSDFGLARQVGGDAGEDGTEYACRRRGFFPVLWMAPESLKHGVFSAASDVWSFGVLAVELVTLGARPYGNWSPLRVLQYVSDGGHPPLPLDATPPTRGLAMLCWRRRPEQRPSAAEVEAYLGANERALRPALWRRADAEAADADSAFSESPSNEPEEPFDFASWPRSLRLP